MSVPRRLSLVTVGGRDVRALRAFYESLGWESNTPEGDEFAAFPLGGAVFAIYRMDLLAAESGQAALPDDGAFRGVILAVNVDEKEHVDAAIAAVREAGGKVLAEPVTRDWGGHSGYWADPEGNVWEVAWLPTGSFDERGALIWPY